jgi:transposase-like protein
MKKFRFTDSQIMAVLKRRDGGQGVPDLCREIGISTATFYKWRSKFGCMDASLMARGCYVLLRAPGLIEMDVPRSASQALSF